MNARGGGFPGRAFFDAVYTGRAPWDVGAPQADLMALIEEIPPDGRIIDLGCGTGDLVICLARRGHSVLGVDFVPAAVDEAERRVRALTPEERARVDLRVGDALRLAQMDDEIGAIVDSGFFHLFEGPARRTLVDEVASVLPRGGRYYMLGFAISIPAPDVPNEVTVEELRRLFSQETGWTIRMLRQARFQTSGFDDIPAVALCAERSS
jgi:ubiquinone/menaquinone biosynthesis C-methylase UbiE